MGILNKAFVGMDIVDGAGKVKNAYKSSSNNKYDNLMGTKPIKSSTYGGEINALNGRNTERKRQMLASEELGTMYKEAASGGQKLLGSQNGINAREKVKKGINIKNNKAFKIVSEAYKKNESKMNKNFTDASNNFKRSKHILKKSLGQVGAGGTKVTDKNVLNGVKIGAKQAGKGALNVGKGALRSAPALAGMAGAGYGTYKLMDHFEKKKKPQERNDFYPKAMGAMVGGALLLNGTIRKNPYQAFNIAGKSIKKSVERIPKNAVKATGPVGKVVVDVAEKVKKGTKNIVDKMDQQSQKGTKHFTKKASEELDFFFEKSAAKYNVNAFAKSVLKENVLKGGAESLVYFGVPSVISYAIGRDFKKGGIKINKGNRGNITTTVVDIPIEKKAATINMSSKTERLIRKGADGVGRIFIPGVASAIIGRNIMDNMKKIKDDNLPPMINSEVPEGKARVIVQTNAKPSESLNSLVKKANDETDTHNIKTVSNIIEEMNHNIQKERGNNAKAVNRNVVLSQGLKKKKRMLL